MAANMAAAGPGLTPSFGSWLVPFTGGADRRMSTWHPLSKIVVACGTLAIGWLALSGPSQAPATVGAARWRPATESERPATDPALGAIARLAQRLDLPPRENFDAVLERPLFSPTRRPRTMPAPLVPVAAEPQFAAASKPEPDEPPFRLVGTVSRRGSSEALVTLGGSGELVRLEAGGELEGWVVNGIGPDHLEVERDGTRRRLEILR
jgi:hypothetical protein